MLLGLRLRRRRVGSWAGDAGLQLLGRELRAFVSACWLELPAGEATRRRPPFAAPGSVAHSKGVSCMATWSRVSTEEP
jgi:hypothetical protein